MSLILKNGKLLEAVGGPVMLGSGAGELEWGRSVVAGRTGRG
jgi:hypothetical protein